MRLLNSRDLTFREFLGHDIEPYAIISHRWMAEEVSHQDFQSVQQRVANGEKPGYGWTKIEHACRIARERGHFWVWIDTCCIDKKSSAELSEAINSMFQWYQDAVECYVFLPDVYNIDNRNLPPERQTRSNFRPRDFKVSDWFKRAWTLQELLAPEHVLFFDAYFIHIGDKTELSGLISQATGIPRKYLAERDELDPTVLHFASLHHTSVAERMRWASQRQATRIEDQAYSLLGLFGVNMPLLYGEGSRAFLRLQTEIIRTMDDESVFAWSVGPNDHWNGILAPNIAAFSRTGEIERSLYVPRQHYEVTNKGIRLTLPLNEEKLLRALKKSDKAVVLMTLNCSTAYKRVYILIIIRPLNTAFSLAGENSNIGQTNYYLGDRFSIRPIEAKKDKLLQIEEGRRSPIYDLVSPAYSDGEVDVPIYFNTGWNTSSRRGTQRRRSLTRDGP